MPIKIRESGAWVNVLDSNNIDTHSFTGTVDPSLAGSQVDGGNRPDGTALNNGDQYVNTATNTLFYWNGSSWGTLSSTDLHSFEGNTAPQGVVSTRPDGSALLFGDQYVDTATDTLYYWNGSVWKSFYTPDTHSFFGGGSPSGVLTTRPDGTALLTGDTYTDTDELPSIVQYVYHTASAAWFLVDEYHTYTGGGHPTLSSFAAGGSRKMYTNTSTKEVYFWSGTAWLLIGPTVHTSDDLATNGFPTVRPNGVDNPLAGDIFTDSVTGRGFYYNGTSYVPYGHYNFVQSTTPAVALTYERDTWVDTDDMTHFVYYNDGVTTAWAQIV